MVLSGVKLKKKSSPTKRKKTNINEKFEDANNKAIQDCKTDDNVIWYF